MYESKNPNISNFKDDAKMSFVLPFDHCAKQLRLKLLSIIQC